MSRVWILLRRAAPPLALALCVLAVAGCGDDDEPGTGSTGAAAPTLAGTQWVLDVDALRVAGEGGPVTSTLVFAKDRVSGSDGCNRFMGSYEQDGGSLTFGALAGTQIACSGAADAVARVVTGALPRVRSAAAEGDRLDLQDDAGETLLSYRASAAGVEGAWSVTSVLYDDAIRGIETGTELSTEFGSDGKVGGDTGCNTFSGSYQLDGERLKIGPLTSTEKACASGKAAKQEAGFIAALESAVRFEQVADDLTLLDAKGRMAVTLKRARTGG